MDQSAPSLHRHLAMWLMVMVSREDVVVLNQYAPCTRIKVVHTGTLMIGLLSRWSCFQGYWQTWWVVQINSSYWFHSLMLPTLFPKPWT